VPNAAPPTRVNLSSSRGVQHILAAAVSMLLGAFGVVSAVLGRAGVGFGVLGGFLLLAGAALAWGSTLAADRLVIDSEAVARTVGRRTVWRLRWVHMAAVRFGRTRWEDEVPEGHEIPRDALWLVPLAAVADHPEIAPALEPRPVDGVMQPTFEVPLGLNPKVWDEVRDAIVRHAPPHLVAG
jgi:hypothetical protein